MAYCGPARLEHAAFKKWEPLSQALALEWHRREQEKCQGCGFHPELTDPERGGQPWTIELASTICEVCAGAEQKREQYGKQEHRVPGEHLVWRHRAAEQDQPAEAPTDSTTP